MSAQKRCLNSRSEESGGQLHHAQDDDDDDGDDGDDVDI